MICWVPIRQRLDEANTQPIITKTHFSIDLVRMMVVFAFTDIAKVRAQVTTDLADAVLLPLRVE